MTPKLYKMDFSPPARAAMMACEIFNVNAEIIDLDLFGGAHMKPDYLKKNPLHTVPLFEDGKVIIHDSHAILQYLAEAYGKNDTWYPKDLIKRTDVNQKLFFDAGYLFPSVRNITISAVLEGENEVPQKKLNAIAETYGFLESFLSENKYLAGNNMTIADLSAIATVTTQEHFVPLDPVKYPKTHLWYQEMTKQPFCKKQNEPGASGFYEIYKKMVVIGSQKNNK